MRKDRRSLALGLLKMKVKTTFITIMRRGQQFVKLALCNRIGPHTLSRPSLRAHLRQRTRSLPLLLPKLPLPLLNSKTQALVADPKSAVALRSLGQLCEVPGTVVADQFRAGTGEDALHFGSPQVADRPAVLAVRQRDLQLVPLAEATTSAGTGVRPLNACRPWAGRLRLTCACQWTWAGHTASQSG